jgi:alginate O-acetyltransferase complex protein AlgI
VHDGLLISLPFWTWFAVYVAVERGLDGLLPRRARYALSCAASAMFLWSFTSIGVVHLGALYVGLGVVFFAAKAALGGERERRSPARLLLAVGTVVTVWALGKIGVSLGLSHLGWLFFLGASFLLVKLWTFCKDLYDGRIRDPEWWSFLAYCTFFPCFISGPMHYYTEFRQAFETRLPLDATALVDGVFRVLHGLVKVLIVAVALRPLSLEALDGRGFSDVTVADLLLRSVIYSLVIYLDFSGYSDIAISSGRLVGVAVPENFRLPYLAGNLRDFWQRWHITFTRFLTQYLFVPFVRGFQRRLSGVTAMTLSSSAYLATFLFCGFWHGSTANYLAWGLYHGVGLAAYDYYRQRRLSARPPVPGAAGGSRWRYGLGALATFLFVSVGWLFFTLPLSFWSD